MLLEKHCRRAKLDTGGEGLGNRRGWASEGAFPAPKQKEVVAAVQCWNGLLDLHSI